MKIDQRSPLLEVGRELRRISGPAEPKSAAIGMEGKRAEITPYQVPIDLDPSPALSLVGKAKPMLKGRKIGALVTDGADGDRLQALRDALDGEGAELAIVAPKIGGVRLKSGKDLAADIALSGAPSVFFDAVAIFASAEGIKPLLKNSAAIDWVRDAFGHLKVIGHTSAAQPLFVKASLADDLDEGVIDLDARSSIGEYIGRRRSSAFGLGRLASLKAKHDRV
jgi:catalase